MSYTSLKYHIVFSTKGHVPLLDSALLPRLTEYIGGIIRQYKGHLLAANGPADHIHLAVALAPDHALSLVLQEVKSGSSKWLHDNFPALKTFAWQEGYSAFTVAPHSTEKLFAYIKNQQEHHKSTTFREELIVFYRKYGLQFDEMYLE